MRCERQVSIPKSGLLKFNLINIQCQTNSLHNLPFDCRTDCDCILYSTCGNKFRLQCKFVLCYVTIRHALRQTEVANRAPYICAECNLQYSNRMCWCTFSHTGVDTFYVYNEPYRPLYYWSNKVCQIFWISTSPNFDVQPSFRRCDRVKHPLPHTCTHEWSTSNAHMYSFVHTYTRTNSVAAFANKTENCKPVSALKRSKLKEEPTWNWNEHRYPYYIFTSFDKNKTNRK